MNSPSFPEQNTKVPSPEDSRHERLSQFREEIASLDGNNFHERQRIAVLQHEIQMHLDILTDYVGY